MNKVKLLTLLTLAGLGSSSAWAERRNPLEGQPAVRHMVELRRLRFEAAFQFITSTNQDYKNAFGPGLNLQFHIFDWLGIGVSGNYTFNSNTPLEDQVRSKLPTAPYQYPGPQPSLDIHDQHVLNISALGSAYASLTPWHGKFALFSALFFNYDFFVNVGVGFVNYTQNNCCSASQDGVHIQGAATPQEIANGGPPTDTNLQSGAQFAGLKIGGMVGVGVHVFFNDWIALQLELRDYIVKANPGGLDTNGDRVLNSNDEGAQNNLFFGFGVSLFLPPHAKISR